MNYDNNITGNYNITTDSELHYSVDQIYNINIWFLPSLDELIAMQDNLYDYGLGDFKTGRPYWSSSEQSATNALGKIMGFGAFTNSQKNNTVTYLRACRTFQSAEYSLRDIGPGGGYIFYINGTTCYEAAPVDIPTTFWSNIDNTEIGTTGTSIGTGYQNTLNIINQAGHISSAALNCSLYAIPFHIHTVTYTDDYFVSSFTDDYYQLAYIDENYNVAFAEYYYSNTFTENYLSVAMSDSYYDIDNTEDYYNLTQTDTYYSVCDFFEVGDGIGVWIIEDDFIVQ